MKQQQIWDKFYSSRLGWKKEAINLPNALKNRDVLEIGVGNGKTLVSILRQKPKSITAIDFSREAIKIASELTNAGNVTFIKTDILSFQSAKKFDVIVCYYVLNNLPENERKQAIKKMNGLLKERGIILFEDFAKGDFRENQKRKEGLLCHFFSKAEITRLFKPFKSIKLRERVSRPIRNNPKLERKIISAIITN